MANKNANLHGAKSAKNDEFYTQISDIERELMHYKHHFRDKVVYCNCDDPSISNFFIYFALNFEELGLKKLITTCYKNQDADLFSQHESERAVYLEYTGDKNGNRKHDPEEIERISLQGDGDFRSRESIDLLKQADIVVTNPPFSLFREYVAQLVEYDKKFVIIGPRNAITYKEVFPLIMSNKIWLGNGFANGNAYFRISAEQTQNYAAGVYDANTGLVKFRNVCWFTNLDISKRHERLDLYKKYTPEEYPKYDNYDAINVDKTSDIPADYYGVMGVPITFLDKYNPDQFEIVAFRKGADGKDLVYSFNTMRADRQTDRQTDSYALLPDSRSTDSDTRRPMVNGPMSMENGNTQEYLSATSIPGMIKNAEGKIGGKITYARITIRRKL